MKSSPLEILIEGCDHVSTREELEQRAKFCFDACVVMRDRFIPFDLYADLGWNVPAVSAHLASSGYLFDYKSLLFRRLMPAIKKVGLLTEAVSPQYAMIGALEYQYADVEL